MKNLTLTIIVFLCAFGNASDSLVLTTLPPDTLPNGFLFLVNVKSLSANWIENWNGDSTRVFARRGGTSDTLACDMIRPNRSDTTGIIRIRWTDSILPSGTYSIVLRPPNTAYPDWPSGSKWGRDSTYPDNIIGYWPDGGGVDRTKRNRNMSVSGGVSVGNVAGQTLKATSYNGIDQFSYYDEVDADSLIKVYPFTVLTWIKVDTNATTLAPTGVGRSNGIYYGIWRYLDNSPRTISDNYGVQLTPAISNIVTVDSGWKHVASKFKANTYRSITVDGKYEAVRTTSVILLALTRVSIGATPIGTPTFYFYGSVCETMWIADSTDSAWINYEFKQTDNNATFWSSVTWVADEEPACSTIIVTDVLFTDTTFKEFSIQLSATMIDSLYPVTALPDSVVYDTVTHILSGVIKNFSSDTDTVLFRAVNGCTTDTLTVRFAHYWEPPNPDSVRFSDGDSIGNIGDTASVYFSNVISIKVNEVSIGGYNAVVVDSTPPVKFIIPDSIVYGCQDLAVTDTVASDTLVCAVFILTDDSTAIVITQTDNGTVTSDPDSTKLRAGESWIITATALPNNHFLRWAGDSAGVTTNPLTVNATGTDTIDISAEFGPDTFYLSWTSTGGNATVTFDGDSIAAYGEIVGANLQVPPGEVGSWDYGSFLTGSVPQQVTMYKDSTITIESHIIPVVTIDTTWGDSIAAWAITEGLSVDSGSTVHTVLSVTPGSRFVGYTGDFESTEAITQFNPTGNWSITANGEAAPSSANQRRNGWVWSYRGRWRGFR